MLVIEISSSSYMVTLEVGNKIYSIALCVLNWYLRFYYYDWVDTSAYGLLVPEAIIRPLLVPEAYHPPSSQISGIDMVY